MPKPVPLELQKCFEDHRLWLESHGEHGQRAVLNGFDLSELDLQGVKLKGADLLGADMTGARLRAADLTRGRQPFRGQHRWSPSAVQQFLRGHPRINRV
jgi:hypothetical protein